MPKPDKKGINPAKDMKPLMDEIDIILTKVEGRAGPGGPPAPMGAEGGAEEAAAAEGGEEVAVEEVGLEGPIEGDVEAEGGDPGTELAQILGVPEDHGKALYEAAQEISDLEGLAAAELAQRLEEDMNLRMRLEDQVAQAKSDGGGDERGAFMLGGEEGALEEVEGGAAPTGIMY